MQKNRCCNQLPDGYREIYKLDLQKDKKTAIVVNLLAVVISIIMLIAGHFIVPVTKILDDIISPDNITSFLGRIIVLIAGLVIYLILHELVHSICMKFFGAKKVKYGFTGLYAFTGCDDYFSKTPYIIIALAPIVVWGIVLLVLNLLVDSSWFWVVYLIQIMNISGAAGDLYVTCKFAKMPEDILVHDSGVAMEVYSSAK